MSGSLDDLDAVETTGPWSLPVPIKAIRRSRSRDSTLEGAVLGGMLAGRAQYRWRDAHRWSASLDVRKKKKGRVAEWPATLNGDVDASAAKKPFAVTARCLREIREFRQ